MQLAQRHQLTVWIFHSVFKLLHQVCITHDSYKFNFSKMERKLCLPCVWFLEQLNWVKLKLPLETQFKGLLSNINPKNHFFNYSADVNPFLHCSAGIIDAKFQPRTDSKSNKVIWRNNCPNFFSPSFLGGGMSKCTYFLKTQNQSVSKQCLQICGIWTGCSVSMIKSFYFYSDTVLLFILYPLLYIGRKKE